MMTTSIPRPMVQILKKAVRGRKDAVFNTVSFSTNSLAYANASKVVLLSPEENLLLGCFSLQLDPLRQFPFNAYLQICK